ncbi:hypothetical protein F3Y22_tig00112980pilonHSYRG00054 [Hibiscus syriacus]|uniref:Clp R domain-containing protein n=1 Tax=Hibiscus syriacus TaxID=106335 RepID=A0A6A2X8C3_HIBSY|nr:hypothetical protein F3Y22_tig00112980pilonHSYRG00054 [Hibiscus syriacus]
MDTSNPVMGSHLSSLFENSRKHKKEMGDDFLLVEHFVLAFMSDKRFGKQLFKNLQLSELALKDAVKAYLWFEIPTSLLSEREQGGLLRTAAAVIRLVSGRVGSNRGRGRGRVLG